MKYYAVIDTNVIVSALLSKNENAATVQILNELFGGHIIPLYHPEILKEYNDVLHRPKFHLKDDTICFVIQSIIQFGIDVIPHKTNVILPDPDDLIFYEVTMEKHDDYAYLVTGNKKHFPDEHFIVTPAEMMNIINQNL